MKLLDETASDFGIMLLNVGHSWGEIQITRPQHCTVCEGKGRGLLFSCPESVVFGWRQNVDKKLIPKTECLKDTVSRVVPFWQNSIVPEIKVRRTMSMHGGGVLYPPIKSVRHIFPFSPPSVFPPLLPFPNHVIPPVEILPWIDYPPEKLWKLALTALLTLINARGGVLTLTDSPGGESFGNTEINWNPDPIWLEGLISEGECVQAVSPHTTFPSPGQLVGLESMLDLLVTLIAGQICIGCDVRPSVVCPTSVLCWYLWN